MLAVLNENYIYSLIPQLDKLEDFRQGVKVFFFTFSPQSSQYLGGKSRHQTEKAEQGLS